MHAYIHRVLGHRKCKQTQTADCYIDSRAIGQEGVSKGKGKQGYSNKQNMSLRVLQRFLSFLDAFTYGTLHLCFLSLV